MNLTGILIKSTAGLDNSVFEKSTVFIAEFNDQGAIGFVVNHPDGRYLNQLVEFRGSPAFPLYDGGPVDKDHLFILHRRPDLIKGGTEVGHGIYYGGDSADAVNGIKSGQLTTHDLKIFIGYCGWDKGQLEAEINEGSWMIQDDLTRVFSNEN